MNLVIPNASHTALASSNSLQHLTMTTPSPLSQTLGLVGWLGAVFITAAIGAAASINASSFYAQLVQPAWAPPAGAFGPVWTALFVLMGVAMWLVWRERGDPDEPAARGDGGPRRRSLAIALLIAQLCANALWSWLFFAWHQGAWAMVDVLVLLALIAATTVVFWRIRRLAGLLMLPYIAWVCLASALTWSVWQNNPAVL